MAAKVNAYDILAVGAHPDDVEVGVGGVLIRLKELGYRTGKGIPAGGSRTPITLPPGGSYLMPPT